ARHAAGWPAWSKRSRARRGRGPRAPGARARRAWRHGRARRSRAGRPESRSRTLSPALELDAELAERVVEVGLDRPPRAAEGAGGLLARETLPDPQLDR